MSSEITDAVQVIRILFDGTELFLRVAGVGIRPLKQLAKLIMGILAREMGNVPAPFHFIFRRAISYPTTTVIGTANAMPFPK